MNEEKYIEERVGKRNPFLVPDGYFDHLADQVMASLPEQPVQQAAPQQTAAPAGDTKFCMECGARIPKGAKFCSECGAKQG